MIDLRKADLLVALCELPRRIVVPLPVRVSEVLDLSEREWRELDAAGMITHDLSPGEVGQGHRLKRRYPGLSANDCFCLVVARALRGVLLTGDALLRRVATADDLEAHGVLWVIDQLEKEGIRSASVLMQALEIWRKDEAVFLPETEILARLGHLASRR